MSRRIFLTFLSLLLAFGPIPISFADEDGDANGVSLNSNDSKKDSSHEKNPQYSHLFGGSSAFSLPLSVSKGAGSLTPSLSLEYSSLSGNGWVGWGWGLEVGRIVRKALKSGLPKYDNLNDGDDDDNVDKFAISVSGISSDMIRIGAYPSHDYKTKFESFYKIQSFPGTASRWEATATDGSKYVFGESVARNGLSNQQFSNTHTWYLSKIINTDGNEMRFTYDKPADSTNGARYLRRIDYTYQNGSSTTSSSQYVLFVREARPDAVPTYSQGGLVKYDERLKEVQMYSDIGNLFKKYVLEYINGNSILNFQSPYCRLWKVTEYGKDGATTLPPFVFTYTDRNAQFTETAAWDVPIQLSYQAQFGNVNNDGFVDIIVSTDVRFTGLPLPAGYDGTKRWYRNKGDGTFDYVAEPSERLFSEMKDYPAAVPHSHVIEKSQLVDINGDSLVDFAEYPKIYKNSGNATWAEDTAWTLPLPLTTTYSTNPGLYYINYGSCSIFWHTCPADSSYRTSCTSIGGVVGSCLSERCCFTGQHCGSSGDAACPTGTSCSGFECKSTFCDGCEYGPSNWFASHNVCAPFPPGECGLASHPAISVDTSARFVDVNGDGYVDQVIYNSTQNEIRLNQGNGTFSPDSGDLPEQITASGGGGPSLFSRKWLGVLFADVNGDGLPDVVRGFQPASGSAIKRVYINRGTTWVYDDTFTLPHVFVSQDTQGGSLDSGARFADLNSDGIDDLLVGTTSVKEVWIGTGRGWVKSSGLPFSTSFVTQVNGVSVDNNTRIVDVNGDGMVDLIQATGVAASQKHTYLSTGDYPNLLKQVVLPTGGKVSFEYTPSTQLKNSAGNYLNPNLPMMKPVVTKISVDDSRGITNSVRSTKITYKNGGFDSAAREFTGFGEVTQTTPDETKIVTTFYQNPESWRGKEQRVSVLDNQGRELRRSESTYQSDITAPYFNPLTQSDSYETSYGPTVTIHTRQMYYYDNTYGNNTRVVNYGKCPDSACTVDNDERTIFNEFNPNTARWIVQAPALKNKLCNGVVSSCTGTSYFSLEELTFEGNTSYTQPPNNVRVIKSLARGSDGKTAWAENKAFDSFGNILESSDALGRKDKIYFDTNKRFPTTAVNALNQNANSTFDYHGNVTQTKDVNQVETNSTYDVFHRPKESRSGPTLSTIDYYNWGNPNTQYTHKTSKQDAAITLWTDEYFDGLGRTYLSVKKGVDTNHDVFVRTAFDNMGRPYQTYLPLFRNEFSPTGNGKGFIETTYDALGRPIQVTKPDGSIVSTRYSGWVTIVTDEKGVEKEFEKDAYGNVVKITEHTSSGNLVTTYEYDFANNLTRVNDPYCNDGNAATACNPIQITWDKLGHKTQIIDPDMGTWKYTYDAVGNLTDIIDAKTCWMHMFYDSLNRLVMKSDLQSTPPPGALVCDHVTFYRVYDDSTSVTKACTASKSGATSCGPLSRGKVVGKLALEAGDKYSREFFYQSPDGLGRLSKDITIIDGVKVVNLYEYNIDGTVSKTTLNAEDAANKITVNYTYDGSGELTSASRTNAVGTTQSILSSISRNANGQPIKKAFGNNVKTCMTYYDLESSDHRLKSLTTYRSNVDCENSSSVPASDVYQNLSYSYDSKGNVKEIHNLKADLRKNYLYDDLDRLIHGGLDASPIDYQYDPRETSDN